MVNDEPVLRMTFFMVAILGLVVVGGIFFLVRALANRSGTQIALALAGVLGVGLFLGMFYLRMDHHSAQPKVVYQQYGSGHGSSGRGRGHDEHGVSIPENVAPRIDLSRTESSSPKANSSTVTEPETNTFTPDENAKKPAWITQGTQTGNGESQFPISSELFATVSECQKDLDSRMPGLIASEVQYLIGEEYPISISPGEIQKLTAETFTEEVPTSQGTWYKIHRLVKIDQSAWDTFRARFQKAVLHARLEALGLGFGSLLLGIGVTYLILRRTPRVVDPTLETFSTT